MPATSNAILSACGATVLVSRRPFKFHRRDLDGEGDVVFIYVVLHPIYVLDCYQIFTTFDLNILIARAMNWLQLSRGRN